MNIRLYDALSFSNAYDIETVKYRDIIFFSALRNYMLLAPPTHAKIALTARNKINYPTHQYDRYVIIGWPPGSLQPS